MGDEKFSTINKSNERNFLQLSRKGVYVASAGQPEKKFPRMGGKLFFV